MSKKLIIDRTPNGTMLSHEDPFKLKLRKIAVLKMSVLPPDLFIKSIKDKVDPRAVEAKLT